jgi:ABC-2 type transport system ATP-binding protein
MKAEAAGSGSACSRAGGADLCRHCQRQTVETYRRLGFVAGEATLWPSLTGAEALPLLGRVHGRVDLGYRDELIDRFALHPTKRVRAYSNENRQKVILIAALKIRPDPHFGRTDQRARSTSGASIPPLHRRSS